MLRRLVPLLLLAALALPAEATEPILLADFEGPDYAGWTTTGAAFGAAPARGALPGQMAVNGHLGEGLANSFLGGDGPTGTLTSPEFTLDRGLIHFLIGGGGFPDKTFVELLVDGRPVRTATGPNREASGSEFLRPATWNVADLRGKSARIRIVDEATGGWGHINVDHVVLADGPFAWPDEREALLDRAEKAVAAAVPKAAEDPARPAFHFRPPAQWMNDPNGTIFFGGYYHLFYQFNPYGDGWGNMHWGHARSKDLVRWEVLPIALWPSKARGEDHVFSGGAMLDAEGKPVLFYTSVGDGRPNEQWSALPVDANALAWRKNPANPLLTTTLPDGTVLGGGMRDPFPVASGGRKFMVVGGDTETEAVIPLYESKDPTLGIWDYLGIVWKAPKSVMEFPECPNFFPLGDKWVLLLSPYRAVEYRIGTFDPDAPLFVHETEGKLDPSDQFYATNIATTPEGQTILFGWVRGFPEKKGWNGCLAVPRLLTLGDDNHPRQHPVPALEALRGQAVSVPEIELIDSARSVEGISTDQIEVKVSLGRVDKGRTGLRLGRAGGAEVAWNGETLMVGGFSVALPEKLLKVESLDLHVFLDRSVLEVFAADGLVAVTRAVPYRTDGPPVLEVFATGGFGKVTNLQAWPIKGIWGDDR
jgi:sucrose-6-phosphate hydrolase SacC (GH32 family)